jgi:DNA-binding NarL/FixJ family response regulator
MDEQLGQGPGMVRVLLADEHEVVRRGIRQVLDAEPDLEICGEAADGREAVAMASMLQPHVVVMDLSLPQLNGVAAIRQIRAALPAGEVLVCSRHRTERLVCAAVAAGAGGYVLKSDPVRELVAAVRALACHRTYFTSFPAAALTRGVLGMVSEDGDRHIGPLTGREREVLQLLAEGKTNQEVGEALNISVKTAETHRATIMRKLGFTSVVELVHYAIRNHLVELPPDHVDGQAS